MAASLRHQWRDTICGGGAYGCILVVATLIAISTVSLMATLTYGRVFCRRGANVAEQLMVLLLGNSLFKLLRRYLRSIRLPGLLASAMVIRCCLEHASSMTKTFLMSDCVVVEIKGSEPTVAGNPVNNSGVIAYCRSDKEKRQLTYMTAKVGWGG
ncbi:hypothetical protein Tco_1325662 [Tanacetum coccineum]